MIIVFSIRQLEMKICGFQRWVIYGSLYASSWRVSLGLLVESLRSLRANFRPQFFWCILQQIFDRGVWRCALAITRFQSINSNLPTAGRLYWDILAAATGSRLCFWTNGRLILLLQFFLRLRCAKPEVWS